MLDTKTAWRPLPGSQTLALSCPAHIIVYHGTRGPGKDVSVVTPVLTDSGWKNAGDITYQDKLVALDGSYTEIEGIYPKFDRELYNVEFFDGAVVEADDEHRWLTLNCQTGYREGGFKVRTTKQLRTMSARFAVPYMQGAIPGKQWTGPDPYMLGYIIANGTTGSQYTTIYSIDDEILDYAKDVHGWKLYEYESQTARRAVCVGGDDKIWRDVLGHHIGDQKHIPPELLAADAATRLAVLQGLMDGDGNIEKGATSRYTTVSKQLVDDVVYLVKSLGGWATWRLQDTTNQEQLGDRGWIYRVNISHHNKFNPFRLSRKADQYCEQKKFLTRGIKSITYSRKGDGVCFAVKHESHCFIVGDFVVTHNTDSQLIRFRRNVGQGYGRHWRGIIFDREYKNLDDLVSKSMRWFPEINEPGAGPKDKPRFLSSKSDYRWVWPTGEELLFRAVKRDTDYWGYHGQEFPFIGWNELTKFPTDTLFDAMMSCNRSSFRPEDFPIDTYDEDGNVIGQRLLPEIPLEIFATCNPHGVGHNWVKKRFINVAPMGQIQKRVVNVFNPKTQQRENITKTQVHLFGSYKENIYLAPEYIAELESITDVNKRRAWLQGDWDIVAGGMFDGEWDKEHHVLKPFKIPNTWKIDRSFDWGSSKPFSVGWWAESDGSDVQLPDGTWRSTVKGDTFRIAEWYGWSGKANQGLNMLAVRIAAGIVEREIAMGMYGRVKPGPADNSIWDTENGNSIAVDMAKSVVVKGSTYSGVSWIRSDKSSGSRKAGWEKIRKYLMDALPQYVQDTNGKKIRVPRERPGMFVFNTCNMFIDLFPGLPRDEVDPDDVDTDAEDHIGDEVRYEILSKALQASTGTTKGT